MRCALRSERDVTTLKRFWLGWHRPSEVRTAYLYLIPSLAIMLLTFSYPMIQAGIQSLYRWNPMRFGLTQKFIGLGNYETILQDPLFHQALYNSIVMTVVWVGIEFLLGLAIALLLYEDIRFKGLAKTSVVIPMMMAPVLVGLIWKMFVDNEFGLFNHLLRLLHLPTVNWIGGQGKWVLPTIILADVWQNTSFVILVLLAGLEAIPLEQFEAAQVDGATRSQQLAYVILPWLKPLILIVLLFRVLFIFRTFDTVCMIVGTSGGVGNSAMVMGVYLYYRAFRLFDLGLASGISIVMLILTAALSVLFTILLYRTVRLE